MFSNWECSSGNQQWTFDFNTCQWVNAETNECQSDNPFLIEAKNHKKDWKGDRKEMKIMNENWSYYDLSQLWRSIYLNWLTGQFYILWIRNENSLIKNIETSFD